MAAGVGSYEQWRGFDDDFWADQNERAQQHLAAAEQAELQQFSHPLAAQVASRLVAQAETAETPTRNLHLVRRIGSHTLGDYLSQEGM